MGSNRGRSTGKAEMSMLQSGQLSEILSEDGKWKMDFGSCNRITLIVSFRSTKQTQSFLKDLSLLANVSNITQPYGETGDIISV